MVPKLCNSYLWLIYFATVSLYPHLFLFFPKCALRTFKYQKEIIYIYVKIKRSSHSPVVFKHGCSLKTYLDHLETKIEIPRYLYFSKNNADMHLILKSDYKFFY